MIRWSLCGILSALCLLHLYWGGGGQWAKDKVNPMIDGKPLLRISTVSYFGAAVPFFLLCAVPVVSMKPVLRMWLLSGMAILFTARAIGDFKYVGFFKSIKGTPFAFWDTRVYSPLNVVLALLSALAVR